MGLEIRQSLHMSQQLVITPQLQQAIKLLQLSHQDLVEEVQQQMVENPALEVDPEGEGGFLGDEPAPEGKPLVEEPAPPPKESSDSAAADKDPLEDLDWGKYMDSIRDQVPGTDQRVVQEDYPSLEATLTGSSTLSEHLEWQLRMQPLSDEQMQAALGIVYNLDENGYLRGITLEELCEELGLPMEQMEAGLALIQLLDPLGVGARDLAECLAIQARVKFPGDEAMLQVIQTCLPLLEKKNYQQISRDLKIPVEEVYQIHRQLTELDPRPGRPFSGEGARYITPDIYIVKLGGNFEAVLNEDGLPKLKVSDYYRRALADNSNRETRDYIQDKLRSAAWLIRSIHQRQRTILRVTQSIIRFQRDFLERGINHLVPLILKDVADDIGMHESTISRVTTAKYVHTPQGIFELKFFFNSGIARCDGDDIASESVKNKIKQLVQSESPERPHSDQKLVELLRGQNINIARRTVAKYREMLGILSSSKRKRMF